jgi:phosphohistidine swiveling domain-containing protein
MARRVDLDDGRGAPAGEPAADQPTPVLDLDDPRAQEPARTGAKAAALSRASQRGMPVLPGFAITVEGVADRVGSPAIRAAWERLSDHGAVPLAVRSSSTIEDSGTTSMAGHFTTNLDVTGWSGFLAAVDAVVASAGEAPMAVLVQPMLDARLGGVLFGIDPISGRRDRILVEVVHGGPASLVSGGVVARSHLLTPRGRLVDLTVGEGPKLTVGQRRELARLSARTTKNFGMPQDVEWAIDVAGRLWLLQSRPVTAAATNGGAGPLLGPGPIAETLPDPLSALEEDLWAAPIRSGIVAALRTIGATSRRVLDRSPVVVSVGGRLAADLDLLGVDAGPRRWFAWLDPRGPARRLGAAWRVGRLRRAMPALAADVIEEVDAELAGVPAPGELDDELLLRLLERSRDALHAVHGHEVLAGVLGLEGGGAAAVAALAEVARGRAAGLSDDEIVLAAPTVLALYPPRIGRAATLPPVVASVAALRLRPLAAREALRLRARWLQEMGARVATEAGRRLAARGALDDAQLVRHLRLEELVGVFAGERVPVDLAARAAAPPGPPLPVSFRLDPDGAVHAVGSSSTGARGAGGGRGVGPVHHAADGPPPAGAVLVTRTLDPALAGMLPGLAGLVAETGSVLSHLAIVARELGVPTVIGLREATNLRSGVVVTVDGETGDVQPAGEDR